jgi:hypothetical protein
MTFDPQSYLVLDKETFDDEAASVIGQLATAANPTEQVQLMVVLVRAVLQEADNRRAGHGDGGGGGDDSQQQQQEQQEEEEEHQQQPTFESEETRDACFRRRSGHC